MYKLLYEGNQYLHLLGIERSIFFIHIYIKAKGLKIKKGDYYAKWFND